MNATRVLSTILLVLAVGVASAVAVPITVPPDLSPGDQYRLVFVTSVRRNAASVNIADYNAFVDTYGDLAIESNWKAIASAAIPEVHALDNTGTDPLDDTGVPFYNLGGERVANDNADLWDGTLLTSILYNELGNKHAAQVWTGTDIDGIAPNGGSAGNAFPIVGDSDSTNSDWIYEANTPGSSVYSWYGMSEVFTVEPVPEPATLVLSLIAIWAMLLLRAQRRSH